MVRHTESISFGLILSLNNSRSPYISELSFWIYTVFVGFISLKILSQELAIKAS